MKVEPKPIKMFNMYIIVNKETGFMEGFKRQKTLCNKLKISRSTVSYRFNRAQMFETEEYKVYKPKMIS